MPAPSKKTTPDTKTTRTKSNLTKEKNVRESKLSIPIWQKLTYLPTLLIVTIIIFLLIDGPLGISQNLFKEDNLLFTHNTPDSSTRSGLYDADAPLVDFFTQSVDYWEPAIYGWAQQYELNPNIIATIIQIESCGHPYVSSSAGAQGLMQVMPPNFQDGDNQLDLNTNAQTGIEIFRDCLRWTTDPAFGGNPNRGPDVGLALVCYNGGPGLIDTPFNNLPNESQNYYKWGTGIWEAASQGSQESATVNQWLNAGGIHLCNRALEVQRKFDPIQALLPR